MYQIIYHIYLSCEHFYEILASYFVCFVFFYKLQPAACRLHTENVICDYFLLSHLWITHTCDLYVYIYFFKFFV